jgi:hypothetical protein
MRGPRCSTGLILRGLARLGRPKLGFEWETTRYSYASPCTLAAPFTRVHRGGCANPLTHFLAPRHQVLCWSYSIEGISGGNETGPCSPCPGANDPELAKGPVLFNLVTDPGETTNLAASQPGVLAKLLVRLKELALESVEPQQWDPPYQGASYYCADCPKHPPGKGAAAPWGPWCKNNGEDRQSPCIPVEAE